MAMSPLVFTALLQATDSRTWCLFLPALPAAAAILALPMAYWNERRRAKPVFLTALTGSRLLLVLAFVALLPAMQPWSGSVLFFALAAYYLIFATGSGACLTWFQALLPARVQGLYLGRRNAISMVTGCVCLVAISALLAHPDILGLTDVATAGRVVFALALAMTVLDWYILSQVAHGRPAPPAPSLPLRQRLRNRRLWTAAVHLVLAGAGGLVAAPVGLLVWYDLGLDALQVGAIGIAAMIGGALGSWYGGGLADRIAPLRLLALGAAAQTVGLAALLVVGGLGSYHHVGTGLLCAVGIALAIAGSIPAAIAGMAQTKLNFANVPDGASGDFACIAMLSSLFGLVVLMSAGAIAWGLQQNAALLPAGMPSCLLLLALAALTALAAWWKLRAAHAGR